MTPDEQIAFLKSTLWENYGATASDDETRREIIHILNDSKTKHEIINALNSYGYGMDKKDPPAPPEPGAATRTIRQQIINAVMYYLPVMYREGVTKVGPMTQYLWEVNITSTTGQKLRVERFRPLFPLIAEQAPHLVQFFPEDLEPCR